MNLANKYLDYLKGLSLIEYPGDRSLRLSLDPLSEYLAALHKLWEYQSNSDSWMQFLAQLEQRANPEEVRGFLLALYDCCDKKGQGNPIQISEDVRKKLTQLADLDQAKVDAYYRERRMRLALEDLKERNPIYQLRAIADLEKIATDDQELQGSAIRCLSEVLHDEKREAQVRRESGKALRQLKESIPLLVFKIQGEKESLQLVELPQERLWYVKLSDSVILELVQIPKGEFWMGAEEGSNADERPRHKVWISREFWMGRYPVTQAQWRLVANLASVNPDIGLDPEPSTYTGDDLPVENVSWNDAVEFCARLSQHFQPFPDQKLVYRLPSEAEWEYACRAGNETPYHFGETITEELANFSGLNTPNRTTAVGQYGVANEFGLYDMHGNIWEWCADHWHENYEGAPTDGSAWLTDNEASSRLRRGGSWDYSSGGCRSAYRDYFDPVARLHYLGLRVVCGLA